MNPKEAIKILKNFATWRQGADTEMPKPAHIGTSLSLAIQALEIQALDSGWISVGDALPTSREVIARAKSFAEDSETRRKGYTEKANVAYAYRTGLFHGLRQGAGQEWVSIEEDLPKPGKEVLILTNGQEKEQVVGRIHLDGTWIMELGDNYDGCLPEGYWPNPRPSVFEIVNVTHWMPLSSSPPKKNP